MSQPTLFDPPPSTVPDHVGIAHVIPLETLHLLTPGKGRTATYDYTLNPYRGCSFGCSYCYAAFFEPDLEKRAAWGQWVGVKHRAVEALARTDLRGKRIYMSSVTDPYQPVEAKTELTRSIVEHLLKANARLVVQTRSPLVARDIDLLKGFEHVRVNMSITTDSDAVRREYEPSCASIERRLEAIEAVKRAGIRVSVCVCPMLPMEHPERFGQLLDRMGVDAVAASYFHRSDRDGFAANTREGAFELAKRDGWTRDRFRECADRLKASCRAYARTGAAFGPA